MKYLLTFLLFTVSAAAQTTGQYLFQRVDANRFVNQFVTPQNGQYLRWVNGQIAAGSPSGSGTVTSVALTAPTGFTVGGSPVTGSGTLTLGYAAGFQGFTNAQASLIASALQPGAVIPWGDVSGKPAFGTMALETATNYLTAAAAATTYQPLDAQLTNLAGLSYAGNSLKVVRVNAGETGFELATVAGGGDALTTNPLSQFASTTSSQLAGVISDETGSGALVFASSPTFSGTLTVANGIQLDVDVNGYGLIGFYDPSIPSYKYLTYLAGEFTFDGSVIADSFSGAGGSLTNLDPYNFQQKGATNGQALVWSNINSRYEPTTVGTVTSVGGTGTVNGLTLTGTVTSSGNLTLGGTLTGTAGAYDATTWNGDNAPPTKDAIRDKLETMTGTGTVTSVAVSGSDGIEVDSGSPVTTSGTIALGVNAATMKSTLNLTGTNSGDVTLSAPVTDILSLSTQALTAVDPGADRIVFWDDSATELTYLTVSTGLTLSGTNLTARSASATQTGIVELATPTETQTGTDTARAVTPQGIGQWIGTTTVTTLGTITTGTWNATSITDTYISSAATWNAKQDGDAQLTSLAALSYASNAGKFIRVNAGETDFELATVSGSGTVTSAAMTVPTGFSVSGSPITTTGTFAVTYTAGYQGYTSAEATKLIGIETGADVTDATNVAAAGALMTSTLGTGVQTALGVNIGTAGSFVTNGGALGTPSSGTMTNVSGTASSLTAGQATAALGLKTATTTVVIDSATAPTSGQVLTATSGTAANWQTPSGGGTVTSVGGTGTVNGLTLTGTVTSSGNLTLGGTLTGTAGAYDATTWNGDNAPPTKDAIRDKLETMTGTGTVTSVAISGTDGIQVDSGSPITTSGTIQLGVDAATMKTTLDLTGTNSGDISLAGTPDYITLSGQTITRGLIDLAADVTGTLPIGSGGTGYTSIHAAITAATSKTTLAGTEEVWINDAGVTKKTTTQDIADLGGGGGGSSTDTQVFTTSGTWTKPAGAKRVFARIVSPGGGGGGGRRGAAASNRFGGGGGGPGANVLVEIDPAYLDATEAVTIGAPGAGGAGATTDDTNGDNGTAGGATGFSRFLFPGGNFGAGGTTSSGTAGSVLSNAVGIFGQLLANTTAAAAGTATNGSNAGAQANINSSTGGGGGGGINNSDIRGNGGLGGAQNWNQLTNIAAGAGGSGAGANGGDGVDAGTYTGTGGGGGAAGDTVGTTPGGNGGNGGGYGAGGGGGGVATNGANGGDGGNGSPGIVIITTEL